MLVKILYVVHVHECTQMHLCNLQLTIIHITHTHSLPLSLSLSSYLYPNGDDKNPDLKDILSPTEEKHISISEKQYKAYVMMDSTFEMCKICAENDKDIKIEPCGHLLCHICLHKWLDSGRSDCPFCREEIKDSEQVIIDSFGSTVDKKEEEKRLKTPSPQPLGTFSLAGEMMFFSGPKSLPIPHTTEDEEFEVGHVMVVWCSCDVEPSYPLSIRLLRDGL